MSKRKCQLPDAAAAEPDARQRFFLALCEAHGLPAPVPEFRFCERRWRFDFAWVQPYFVALEVDGGAWMAGGGRHNRGKGFLADMEKMNAATVMGWRVIRCTPQQVKTGEIMDVLKEVLSVKETA
jgi:hypothetical protein